jgi:hypothetical protein
MNRKGFLTTKCIGWLSFCLISILFTPVSHAQSGLGSQSLAVAPLGLSGGYNSARRPVSPLDANEEAPPTHDVPSELSGVTRYPNGLPLPEAEVVITGADVSIDRTAVSGSDGTFEFKNLKPGEYQVTAKKEGFSASAITSVELAAGQSFSLDLSLRSTFVVSSFEQSSPQPSASASASAGSSSAPPATTFHGGFFRRFGEAYLYDWKGTTPANVLLPNDRRQGMWPAPESGPPFPFSDWPIGGTVWIGASWAQSSPLMQAIWSGPHGDAWKKSGIQIYGWLNFGGNWSTSHAIPTPNDTGKYGNAPTSYDEVANAIEPDQEVIYIEREPNTVQTDHFDWGFRFTDLWGLDYRFTTSKGIFSSQLLGKNAEGCPNVTCRQYGDDPVMMYVDLYFPHLGQGSDLRIGRYVSLPDIEAQLAPNNYSYSHSLLYTFDCYTQTGINDTTRISNHWTIQIGLSPGCDVAPWDKKDAKLTLNACIQYEWNTGKDDVNLCDNETNLTHNSGQYAYNNLQAYYLTYYHVLSKRWHTDTEYWYQWEKNTPDVNPAAPANVLSAAAPLLETNANGAWCNPTPQGIYPITCYAPEWAITNYLEFLINAHNYLSFRNEYFDDMRGQRTGVRTRYTEQMFNWGHWIGTSVLFRPEFRYEHSFDNPVYQVGTKKTQFTVAGDIIWFF